MPKFKVGDLVHIRGTGRVLWTVTSIHLTQGTYGLEHSYGPYFKEDELEGTTELEQLLFGSAPEIYKYLPKAIDNDDKA